ELGVDEAISDDLGIAARDEQVRYSIVGYASLRRLSEKRACATGRRRNLVVPDHPADLLDQVLLDRYVKPKRGRRNAPTVRVALDFHLQSFEHLLDPAVGNGRAEQRGRARAAHPHDRPPRCVVGPLADGDRPALATADLEQELRRALDRACLLRRVDAALEA